MQVRIPVVALAMTLLACSYADDPHDRKARAVVVEAVGTGATRIVVHPVACPETHVVLTAGDPHDQRHAADRACLTKLAAGATIELVMQRERQGCMPGTVYYKQLGGCTLGAITETTEGPACAGDDYRQTGTPRD